MGTDSNIRLQSHTDELFARCGLLIFSWIIVSIPWLYNIDSVLEYLVVKLDPCEVECLNLYQPEKWSELRWLASAILGFATIMPLISQQFWSFSKPGLTNSERKLFKMSILLAPLIFLLAAYLTMFIVLPNLFSLGHSIQSELGFVAKYDVINLISFSTAIIWLEIIVVFATSIMISSGLTGNLDSSNANWWRIRVYGIVTMITLLSFYERTTNGLLMALISILLIEALSRPWTTKLPKYHIQMETKFDSHGEILTSLNVICGCQKQPIQTLNKSHIVIENICNQEDKQDDLLRILMFNEPNNVILHQCNNKLFIKKFESLVSSTKSKIIVK
ncbi:MAG: twin-arginine translocase subunit TatC [Candidatus Poseidoniaceae archaeon]|nr:twin-arginine translocase subunit TatC [Candidatus Poseidoniaceae archaeon]MBL6895823.1 twin-arginine translocase subunit TatC [Candidatus Poseidoniaceae archaeon]